MLTLTCFKIEVGSRRHNEIEIDMESLGKHVDTSATEDEKVKALGYLTDELCSIFFTASGHRNDQAVNTCISLHVLGYDPIEWFDNFFERVPDKTFYDWDISEFKEHVKRVSDYLWAWGPPGSEAAALGYRL